MTKPLIYVAGPYTRPDPVVNTRRAIEFGMWVHRYGGVPLIPHLTMFVHFLFPQPLEFWYAYDIDALEQCQAVFRFDGDSTGADREVERAIELGIPVFTENERMGLLDFIDEFIDNNSSSQKVSKEEGGIYQ